LTISG